MVEQWQARPDRPALTGLFHLRIADEVERLKQEPTWRSRARNAITLTKEGPLRVVLIVLGAGAKLHEHQTGGPLMLHVLSGSLRFHAAGRALEMKSGEIVALESAAEHEVEAVEESVFLLAVVHGA
jgi:quercetin dioxygenase-like cupin family protein